MNSIEKTNKEYWLTRAQFNTRKLNGQLETGAIYHFTDGIDTTVTQNSENLITSGAVYTALGPKSSVIGTSDGTNWTAIQIDGVTKNIPSGGGSEPDAYLKSASSSGNTLTLVNKDNTTTTYTPDLSSKQDVLSAGDGIYINSSNEISATVGTGLFFDDQDRICLNNATQAAISAVAGKSTVTGTNDGTNWTSLTVDGTTKNIPAAGTGGVTSLGGATGAITLGSGLTMTNNELAATGGSAPTNMMTTDTDQTITATKTFQSSEDSTNYSNEITSSSISMASEDEDAGEFNYAYIYSTNITVNHTGDGDSDNTITSSSITMNTYSDQLQAIYDTSGVKIGVSDGMEGFESATAYKTTGIEFSVGEDTKTLSFPTLTASDTIATNSQLSSKQDSLTAGSGITLSSNTISVDTSVVQAASTAYNTSNIVYSSTEPASPTTGMLWLEPVS